MADLPRGKISPPSFDSKGVARNARLEQDARLEPTADVIEHSRQPVPAKPTSARKPQKPVDRAKPRRIPVAFTGVFFRSTFNMRYRYPTSRRLRIRLQFAD